MIMLSNDLKLLRPDVFLLTSIIFLSSFASNFLYLFEEPQQKSMTPTLLENDFRAVRG